MATGRSTNLALLGLTTGAVVTGFAAFGIGSPDGRWVVAWHSITGLAVLLLTPWKTLIARRGLRRRGGRWLSLALTATTLTTIASGFLLVSGVAILARPLTMMQLHVGAGLSTLALAIVHARQRRMWIRGSDLSRRNLVRLGGLAGLAVLAYGSVELGWRALGSAAASRRFTGSHEIDQDAPLPATQWLNDRVQRLDPADHRVVVLGTSYTTRDLASFGDVMDATLDCTGGWFATREWRGARLDRLIGAVSGSSIVVTSVTGYWRRFPISEASRLLLATHVSGASLEAGNGAPVRLVAPARRGFWWIKWVESVVVDDVPPWWQPPLPLA